MTDSCLMLEQKYLKELKKIFQQIIPDAQVWAYGSRVDGTAHDGSDLDIAVVGTGDITKLKTAIQESNIPFLVDVVKFENLPESFQKEILKKYVVLKGVN